jgi:phosphatidylglycerophosphatase C
VAHRPAVAAFDFDGTLTTGGSVAAFLRAVAGYRWLVAGAVGLPGLTAAAVTGGTRADRAKEALFVRTLAGMESDQLRIEARDFGRIHYARHARHDTAARVAAHRERGHRVVVVSASPEVYLGPAVEVLGAEALIATRLEVDDDGRLTGHYDGANCRGREKVRRLRRWIDDVMPDADPVVWAYGNSRGDRALLEHADVGVNVARLGRWGRLRHFPSLEETAVLEPSPTNTWGSGA